MTGRRTFKGRAVVARTNYMSGKRRAYWVECWGAAETPTTNGRIESACITLCNQEGDPPMHHVYCDQMKQINPTQSNRTILIELRDEHTVELQVEDDSLWRSWTKHLGLLITIPFYPIPAEPSVGLPREFLTDISPQFYDVQGVMAWGVVVVQAGIGKQERLKNAFCVVVVTSDDRLKIYPWNAGTVPLITWDRDKLRRSGSIGDMVFMEAGRRCRFGPGLLWMFAETSVSVSLREGLHAFLFRGGNNMSGHCRRAAEVSIASNRSSAAEASFDQDSARTPDSLATQRIPSHTSVRAKHHSPPVKQHSQLSTSSCDDPIELDSKRDSPVGGRSQTLPAHRQSQQSDYCNVVGGSPPFAIEEDDSLRRHTLIITLAFTPHSKSTLIQPPHSHPLLTLAFTPHSNSTLVQPPHSHPLLILTFTPHSKSTLVQPPYSHPLLTLTFTPHSYIHSSLLHSLLTLTFTPHSQPLLTLTFTPHSNSTLYNLPTLTHSSLLHLLLTLTLHSYNLLTHTHSSFLHSLLTLTLHSCNLLTLTFTPYSHPLLTFTATTHPCVTPTDSTLTHSSLSHLPHCHTHSSLLATELPSAPYMPLHSQGLSWPIPHSLLLLPTFYVGSGSLGDDKTQIPWKELEAFKEQILLCSICCDRKKNCALNCGHTFCQMCADQMKSCPICRKAIKKRLHIYES